MHRESRKNRITWIELAQILSMLMIVFHHSIPNNYEVGFIFELLANSVQYPSLAVFFLTSGFFACSYHDGEYIQYLKKRCIRLLVPFVFANMVMLFPKYYIASVSGNKFSISPVYIFTSFIDPHGNGILPHLWFLPTLFILNCFSPFFRIIKLKSDLHKSVVLAFLFVLASIPFKFTTVFCVNDIRLYAFYFVFGYFFRNVFLDNRSLFSNKGLFVLSLILSILTLQYKIELVILYRTIITFSGCCAIIMFAKIFNNRCRCLRKIFSGKTYTIYIYSLCIQNFVEVLARKLEFSWYFSSALMFVSGVGVSLFMNVFLKFCFNKVKVPSVIRSMFGL